MHKQNQMNIKRKIINVNKTKFLILLNIEKPQKMEKKKEQPLSRSSKTERPGASRCSVLKTTYWSCRGPEYQYQHLHCWTAHNYL